MYKNKKSGPGPPEIESSVPTHLPNHTTSLQQPKADFHDAPFSADALEKRFSPRGKLQGRSSGSSLSQRLPGPRGPVASVLRPVRNLQQRELLPIFTAFPFHHAEPHNLLHTQSHTSEPKNTKIMKHAYVFPGQGAQAVGMGKDLYDNVPAAKELFEKANEILGFRITDIMFAGTDEQLKQTKVTQPAVFLHSVIMAKALGVNPDAVAGHSLGEFSALVVAGALSFEDGLKLVSKRAMAMQAACEAQPGTMAAILGLDDKTVEEICASIEGVVVAANYNCPGQLVISGAVEAVEAACEKAKAAGARRALRLPVGGAFHSPLMEPAKQELEKAINEAPFQTPSCPIYQNVDAKPYTDPAAIKANLIAQLTAPVRWTYIVKNMLEDGVTEFTELGPGTVLQGLIRKVDANAAVESKSTL